MLEELTAVKVDPAVPDFRRNTCLAGSVVAIRTFAATTDCAKHTDSHAVASKKPLACGVVSPDWRWRLCT